MKRSFFVAFSLACGIATVSMLAGCSSKPKPSEIKQGLHNWLVSSFNINARYAHAPENKIDISVDECSSLSDSIMDEMHLPDATRDFSKKNAQLCHVNISYDSEKYKVLLVVLENAKDHFMAKPVFLTETTDQETKDGHFLFN